MDPGSVGKPLVFVADGLKNIISIFLQAKSHKLVGQITFSGEYAGFLNAIATDPAGNLYVPEAGASSGQVGIFAPPYTKGAKLTLQAGIYPNLISVSRSGLVAIETCSASCASSGIWFYAPGSTTPCAEVAVTQPHFSYAVNLAFDAAGDLYALGGYSNASNQFVFTVGKIEGGCSATKIRVLTVSGVVGGTDIHVDKVGQIAILDVSDSNTLKTFNATKHSLGSPVSTTPLTTSGFLYGAFAFAASGKDLYTGEEVSSEVFADKYDYPAGGAAVSTIEVTPPGAPYGIAVTPPLW
jgi:hypothetical protein